jgi:hypothetical protein
MSKIRPGEAIGFAYLYSSPFHGKRHIGVVFTRGGEYLPEWWPDRGKRDIMVAELTEDDTRQPLLDIARAHLHRLNAPAQAPQAKPAPVKQLPPGQPVEAL